MFTVIAPRAAGGASTRFLQEHQERLDNPQCVGTNRDNGQRELSPTQASQKNVVNSSHNSKML